MTTWRIVKSTRADRAFDGEGARLEGGRWNSRGVPLVYTAGSASLAALAMLVHIGRPSIISHYALIACTFDDSLVERLDRRRLPENWRSYPAPSVLAAIGDEWATRGSSAVLEVPSAVIAAESNYLLNPRHFGFASIRIMEPERFEFDARLLNL